MLFPDGAMLITEKGKAALKFGVENFCSGKVGRKTFKKDLNRKIERK